LEAATAQVAMKRRGKTPLCTLLLGVDPYSLKTRAVAAHGGGPRPHQSPAPGFGEKNWNLSGFPSQSLESGSVARRAAFCSWAAPPPKTHRAHGLPGGKLRAGEDAATAALRETVEETGYVAGYAGTWHTRRARDGVDYTTFLRDVEDEFTPRLNKEHDQWGWFDPKDMLAEREVRHD
jgi:hypothetical protein